jgi:hypothetical protein
VARQKGQERRAPGQIRDAIVKALRRKQGDASVQEIQEAVERELGGDVPRSSVRSYLQLGTDRTEPIFDRTGHGRYRLRR